ncbi:MAG: TRAP transporter substrate-binding protein DctP [Dehalococcoidia bacterium]|jgi:TRAP-type C4-dicarboxylate transport system substrate-binding protein
MKKRTFIISILLSAIIVITLVASACGEAEPEEVIELKFGGAYPAEQVESQVQIEWMQKIEEETDGRVHFTAFWAGALLSSETNYSDLKAGVADVGNLTILLTEPAGFPLSSLLEWAYAGVPNYTVARQIGEQIYEEFPELQAEAAEVKSLSFLGYGSFWLHTTDKPINTLADLDGLEIMPGPPTMGAVYEKFGVTPMMMPTMDFYSSLQKGIMAGLCCPMEGLTSMSWYEVTKYHTNLGSFSGPNGAPCLAMNLDTWNSLPSDIQQVFEDNIDWYTTALIEAREAVDEEAITFVSDLPDHEIITASAEDVAEFSDATFEVLLAQAAELDATGLPATEMINRVRELIEEYS